MPAHCFIIGFPRRTAYKLAAPLRPNSHMNRSHGGGGGVNIWKVFPPKKLWHDESCINDVLYIGKRHARLHVKGAA